MQWYEQSNKHSAGRTQIVEKEAYDSDDDTAQELRIITDVKKLIVSANLDRASIFLDTLASFEYQLRKGRIPENMPQMLRNLAKKPEIAAGLKTILNKYTLNGVSYYYQWGINQQQE